MRAQIDLGKYIAEHRADQFAWGRTDCATFVNGAVKAMTGVDLFREFAGRYNSESGFYKLCSGQPFADFMADVLHRGGFVELDDKTKAKTGDVVLVDLGGIETSTALGIVINSRIAVQGKPQGIAWLRRRRIVSAWRIEQCPEQ